jgi:putative ABC transport system permease protein
VRASAPVLEGYASSPLLPGQALRILGVDPFSEGPFRPFVSGGTSGFGRRGAGVDVGSFITTRGGVVMSAPTAARAGVEPGDSLPALVERRRVALSGRRHLEPADRLTRTGLSDVLLMDVSGAQHVLGAAGALTRIDLALPETAETEVLLARIAALLPGASRSSPPGRARRRWRA